MTWHQRDRRRTTKASAVRAALLLGAGAVMAGCGGSPITPPPTPTPPPVVQPPGPPVAPRPPTLGVTKILSFGDSMTEGVDQPPLPLGLSTRTLSLDPGRPQSYPFKLKLMVDQRYPEQTLTVHNAGIAGKQARDDRGRFSQALSESRPELVLLMEGANDLNAPLAPGEGVNARVTSVVDALEDMVRDAVGRGVPVFIATLPPQRPGGPKAGSVDYLPRFNESVKAMAQKKGAQVVDINALMPLSFIGVDGLHPTEAGYQRIAEIWFEAIKARYERAPQ